MNRPRVTVLMAVHNGERFLREAIESILNQSFKSFEFLIINDASTDNTGEILKSLDDARIRVIENETNIGLTRSLNRGVSEARGEYIARMDADDISLRHRIEKQVAFLDEFPDVGVVGGAAQTIDAQGLVIETYTMPQGDREIAWDLVFYSPLIHPAVVMRKDILVRYGGYDSSRTCAQDYDLWCRLRNVTRFHNFAEPLIFLRKHPDNITSRRTAEQATAALQISARVIGLTTGTEPLLKDVETMRNGYAETSAGALRAGWLLYEIFHGMKRHENWSEAEERKLRRDATKRIMIMLRPYVFSYHAWPLLFHAFQISPGEALKRTLAAIGRIVSAVFVGPKRDITS